MIGAIIHYGFSINSLKVLVLTIIVMLINPSTSHEIARLATKSGINSTAKTKTKIKK